MWRAGSTATLDRADTVDLFGFIPTYGAFLAFFFLAMMRAGGGFAALVGLAALAVGVAFDVLETLTQLRLTRDLPGSEAALIALAVGSRGKFAALALAAMCAGLTMVARGGIAGRVAGVVCTIGAALGVVALVDPSARGLLTLANAVAWLVILLYVIVVAIARDNVSPQPDRTGGHGVPEAKEAKS